MPEVATSKGTTSNSRRRLHIFYSGRVQGVGFRYTVKSVAAGFMVAGTVRNLPDGRVELLAEGESTELKAFQQAIRDEGLAHLSATNRPSGAMLSAVCGDLRLQDRTE